VIGNGCKPTVNLRGIRPEMVFIDSIVQSIFNALGYACVRTSINDSKHMDGSRHYSGCAIDYRVPSWPTHAKEERQKDATVARLVRDSLPPGADVVLESNPPHLHVEWDPRDNVA
jgi:hypothetical protein